MEEKQGLVGLVFRVLILVLSVTYTPCRAEVTEPEKLTVALYPYVPEARDLFFKLESAFEETHPGINVDLVEKHPGQQSKKPVPLSEDYYKGGLLQIEADIYEIDTVLLGDMVQSGKISPLELPEREFLPEARSAVQFDGKTWGVPHWVCGNFLFYEKGDSAIEHANSWQELAAAFQSGGSLVVDFKGTSTLGEWYLTSLTSLDGDLKSVLEQLRSSELSKPAVEAMQTLLQLCPAGYCRSEDLHNRTGYYARMFARGKVRAYIGYSETIHYGLQEISDNCGPTDGCRTPDQIAVRALPPRSPQGRSVGWTDALAISANLTDKKRQLAEDFIKLATSWDSYVMVLNPDWPAAPRYLLPPYIADSQKPALDPPLYQAFYKAFGSRVILTADGLNKALRDRGKVLDCQLASERGDRSLKGKCP